MIWKQHAHVRVTFSACIIPPLRHFLFRDSKEMFPLIQLNPGRVNPSKRSSCCLVNNEIVFLTHCTKLCLLICNKCTVIYYKIAREGLPSKRRFWRIVANKTKTYFFEGILLGCPHKKILVVSLPSMFFYQNFFWTKIFIDWNVFGAKIFLPKMF